MGPVRQNPILKLAARAVLSADVGLLVEEVTDKNKLAPFLWPMVYIFHCLSYLRSRQSHTNFKFGMWLEHSKSQLTDDKPGAPARIQARVGKHF